MPWTMGHCGLSQFVGDGGTRFNVPEGQFSVLGSSIDVGDDKGWVNLATGGSDHEGQSNGSENPKLCIQYLIGGNPTPRVSQKDRRIPNCESVRRCGEFCGDIQSDSSGD